MTAFFCFLLPSSSCNVVMLASGFNFQVDKDYISSCSSTSHTQKQALPVQIMEERMGKNRKVKVHNKE